jgi:hypothetical protein
MALEALADGVTYRASQYSNTTQTTDIITVQAGTACSQLLRCFSHMLPREPPPAVEAVSSSRGAQWRYNLRDAVSAQQRVTERMLLAAYKKWLRCCWLSLRSTAVSTYIHCPAPARQSAGKGTWRGAAAPHSAAARSAANWLDTTGADDVLMLREPAVVRCTHFAGWLISLSVGCSSQFCAGCTFTS